MLDQTFSNGYNNTHMNQFDIVVIGQSFLADQILKELSGSKLKIVQVKPTVELSFSFHQFIYALKKPEATPPHFDLKELEIINGNPVFQSDHQIQIEDKTISSKKFILSPDPISVVPPFIEIKDARVIFPTKALQLNLQNKKIAILGSGEIACLLSNHLGQKNQIHLYSENGKYLDHLDADISSAILTLLKEQNIQTSNFPVSHNELSEFDFIVIASQLSSGAENFHLKNTSCFVNPEGEVVINEEAKTSSPTIWAAGPLTKKCFSLGLIEWQARIAANNVTAKIFGTRKMGWEPIPKSIPLSIPFATIGFTKQEALLANKKNAVESIYLISNSRIGNVQGFKNGLIKIVAKKRNAEILGVHIFAPHAEEMIHFFSLAMRAGISLHELVEEEHFISMSWGEITVEAIKQWLKENT